MTAPADRYRRAPPAWRRGPEEEDEVEGPDDPTEETEQGDSVEGRFELTDGEDVPLVHRRAPRSESTEDPELARMYGYRGRLLVDPERGTISAGAGAAPLVGSELGEAEANAWRSAAELLGAESCTQLLAVTPDAIHLTRLAPAEGRLGVSFFLREGVNVALIRHALRGGNGG
jgi:hypothetical protein